MHETLIVIGMLLGLHVLRSTLEAVIRIDLEDRRGFDVAAFRLSIQACFFGALFFIGWLIVRMISIQGQ